MTTWAVIATGATLLPDPAAIAARVRHLPTVVANDAFRIAPWARALVFADPTWLLKNRDARLFAGVKVCNNDAPGILRFPRAPAIFTNTNSGLLALHYAIRCGATRVLLLGVDMRGTHYFGAHRDGLENTTPDKFAQFILQFEDFAAKRKPRGVEVINCNLHSALTCFPKMTLDAALQLEMEHA